MKKPGPKKKLQSKIRKPRSISLRDEDWKYVVQKGEKHELSASGYIERLIWRDKDEGD